MHVPEADGHRPPSYQFAPSPVTADTNLAESLRRIAEAGRDLLDGCIAASVTVIDAGRPTTMGATDEVANDLDQAQYDAGDGPCLTSAREERLVRIDDLSTEDRWPAFRAIAQRHGVASSMSVPLLLEGPSAAGALNAYGETRGVFGDGHVKVAEGFAEQASIAVSNVVAYWAALDLSTNLKAAMEHRGVIEQAKGILMGELRCSPDEAFDVLRQRSQRENRKLRDVASDVVQSVQTGER